MRFRVFGAAVFAVVYSTANAAECSYTPAKSELSRVVAVDSVNGPVYGLANTSAGQADPATASPLVLNDERRGNTIGAESSSTDALDKVPFESAKVEIEKGLTAVSKAANAPIAPFLRVSSANVPPEILAYLKERGVSLWFYDLPAGDNEPGITASQLANRTLARIRERGRGVIQFHDNRKVTVDALDSILTGAKLSGFKVVHIVPAAAFAPKGEYLMAAGRPATVPVIAASFGASHHLVETARRRVRAYHDGEQRPRSPTRHTPQVE